jgi:hypothetical protein
LIFTILKDYKLKMFLHKDLKLIIGSLMIKPTYNFLSWYYTKYIDKINWSELSINPSPRVITLLEKNIDKIDWFRLSTNPGAINLLEKY